ncbi:MAG: ATP phosphoribosyltransferase regulatory subunit [Pseudomonadota bacterium]
MLVQAQIGPAHDRLDKAVSHLRSLFTAAGHTPVDPPYLYLAETLLDLYGEDLRARAFLFQDPERGNELGLRPDFTVPVALAHAAMGWDRAAAYGYCGAVFRRQPQGMGRPVEYVQAGIERFGDDDPVAADALVFDLLTRGLRDLGVPEPKGTIGDLSIPFALLDALDMPDRRRADLKRHFWRPERFGALLRRAIAPPEARQGLRELLGETEIVGRRSPAEVLQRISALEEEQDWRAMPPDQGRLIDDVLGIKGPADRALTAMQETARAAEIDIAPVIRRFEQRLEALAVMGHQPETLHFDASFGRNLEYYDGFVFELRAPDGGSHPPLAGGGRYDTLTTRMGAPGPVPAIGGIIRPQAVLDVSS